MKWYPPLIGFALGVTVCLNYWGFVGYGVAYDRGVDAGAELCPQDCPTGVCPPTTEQHPVEEWVCEREEDWGKVLSDCNEHHAAADALMEMTGELQLELEACSLECTGKVNEGSLADFEQWRRETQKIVRALAAKRALEHEEREDDAE